MNNPKWEKLKLLELLKSIKYECYCWKYSSKYCSLSTPFDLFDQLRGVFIRSIFRRERHLVWLENFFRWKINKNCMKIPNQENCCPSLIRNAEGFSFHFFASVRSLFFHCLVPIISRLGPRYETYSPETYFTLTLIQYESRE